MTPSKSETLHYRCIDPDYGGTYTHRPRSKSDKDKHIPEILPAIGTYKCITCVGVYFKLSANTCFVAHINVTYIRNSGRATDDEKDSIDHRILTPSEGTSVYREMIRRFETKSSREFWPDVEQITNIIFVCPYLHHPLTGETLSGTCVIRAIRDFFKQPDLPVDSDSEGFVVTHETGEVVRFPFSELGAESDMLRLADDGATNYKPHSVHGDESPGWFINLDEW